MIPADSPASALAAGQVLRLAARVRHTRLGALRHAFGYRADYLLFDPERVTRHQGLLRRGGRGLFGIDDRDHGRGEGASWVWDRLREAGLTRHDGMVLGLLTQPRFMGYGFNPVSFWLLWDNGQLIACLAEVSNTWRQTHAYLCRLPGFAPISPEDRVQVNKVFHVSPFQDVGGSYGFRFAIEAGCADILIHHKGPSAGLLARMQGRLEPLRQSHLIQAALRRPGGALRIMALIHLQALRLKLRGAGWRRRPAMPDHEVTE